MMNKIIKQGRFLVDDENPHILNLPAPCLKFKGENK